MWRPSAASNREAMCWHERALPRPTEPVSRLCCGGVRDREHSRPKAASCPSRVESATPQAPMGPEPAQQPASQRHGPAVGDPDLADRSICKNLHMVRMDCPPSKTARLRNFHEPGAPLDRFHPYAPAVRQRGHRQARLLAQQLLCRPPNGSHYSSPGETGSSHPLRRAGNRGVAESHGGAGPRLQLTNFGPLNHSTVGLTKRSGFPESYPYSRCLVEGLGRVHFRFLSYLNLNLFKSRTK